MLKVVCGPYLFSSNIIELRQRLILKKHMTHSVLLWMKLANQVKSGAKAQDFTSVNTKLIHSSMSTLLSNISTLRFSSLLNMVTLSLNSYVHQCSQRSSMAKNTTISSSTGQNKHAYILSLTTVCYGSTTRLQWSTMLLMYGNQLTKWSLKNWKTAFLLTGSAANA